MTRIQALILLLIMIMVSGCDELRSIFENNKAIKKLEQNDALMSEQLLLKSMAENPFHPIPHINLGILYEINKKYDRATKEYESVIRYNNLPPDWIFVGQFNAGNSSASDKKIDQALKFYQAALDTAELNKMSPEDMHDVKNNIELLMNSNGGGGGGGGQGQNQSENKDKGEGEGDQNQNPNYGDGKEQQQKNQFKSEKLTQEDVRKILEELKSQEKKIRAQDYGGKAKEKSGGNDW